MNLQEYDKCICAEWDGKGWSTCGVPCPEHWKSKNGETIQEARDKKRNLIIRLCNDHDFQTVSKDFLNCEKCKWPSLPF